MIIIHESQRSRASPLNKLPYHAMHQFLSFFTDYQNRTVDIPSTKSSTICTWSRFSFWHSAWWDGTKWLFQAEMDLGTALIIQHAPETHNPKLRTTASLLFPFLASLSSNFDWEMIFPTFYLQHFDFVRNRTLINSKSRLTNTNQLEIQLKCKSISTQKTNINQL